jgi:hypothetical protein
VFEYNRMNGHDTVRLNCARDLAEKLPPALREDEALAPDVSPTPRVTLDSAASESGARDAVRPQKESLLPSGSDRTGAALPEFRGEELIGATEM